MGWTLDNALDHSLITVVARDDRLGIYHVRVGVLKTVVTIKLVPKQRGRWIAYEQSHAVKTPEQAGPYWTSRAGDDTAGAALHKAITGLTSWYEMGIRAGHSPAEDWLWTAGQRDAL